MAACWQRRWKTYSKVLNARFSVFRSVMLLMAAGNVPVNELLAKLMLCKSTEVMFTCAIMSFTDTSC